MKTIKIISAVSLFLLGTNLAFASIDKNLKYGQRDKEVTELQEFLIDKGFLKTIPSTFFGLLTLKAVKAYQTSINVSSTGFVGALTREKINKEIDVEVTSSNEAEIKETGNVTTVSTLMPGCSSLTGFSKSTGKSCSVTQVMSIKPIVSETVKETKICQSGKIISKNEDCAKTCPDGEIVLENLTCRTVFTQVSVQAQNTASQNIASQTTLPVKVSSGTLVSNPIFNQNIFYSLPSKQIKIGSFIIKTPTSEAINIRGVRIKILITSPIKQNNVTNPTVWYDTVKFMGTVMGDASINSVRSIPLNNELYIDGNSSKVLDVYADVQSYDGSSLENGTIKADMSIDYIGTINNKEETLNVEGLLLENKGNPTQVLKTTFLNYADPAVTGQIKPKNTDTFSFRMKVLPGGIDFVVHKIKLEVIGSEVFDSITIGGVSVKPINGIAIFENILYPNCIYDRYGNTGTSGDMVVEVKYLVPPNTLQQGVSTSLKLVYVEASSVTGVNIIENTNISTPSITVIP